VVVGTVSTPCAVKLQVCAVVGVPVIAPVDDPRASPAQIVPADTLHVTAPVQLDAASVWLYAVPTVPAGRGDPVVIVHIGTPVTVKETFTGCGLLTIPAVVEEIAMVPEYVPAPNAPQPVMPTVRLPAALPDVGARVIHVWLGVPALQLPRVVSSAPIAVVCVAGSDPPWAHVNAKLGGVRTNVGPVSALMLSARFTVIVGLEESVAEKSMGQAPASVGVPATTPVEELSVRPAQIVPETVSQDTEPVPPLVASVWL
jgi:hypothetical protein